MVLNAIDLEAFEENYQSAKGFHNRAKQFLHEGQSSSVIFNVAAVAIERYLVALCDLHGAEPRNHNYICLMDAVEKIIDVPLELNKEIRSLDLIFGICSLENYYHGSPNESDSNRALSICNEVQKLFNQIRSSSKRAKVKNNQKEF